ncbi:hypothetical protein MKS88_004733 [Plasmodium brasilianum]|nr:hypothetical protein MKS88_004733 [Plasmodium brasilianum]
MKVKSKLFLFIKIETFIILTVTFVNIWMRRTLLMKNYVKKNYRLLARYKKEKCSNIVWEKKDILNNDEYEKKYISRNGRVSKGKNKLPKVYASDTIGGCKQAGKSKSSEYNNVNTYYGKRMLDKIYYKNVVRYSKNADFKFMKKCIQQNDGSFFALFIFHLVVGVAFAMLMYLLYDNLSSMSTRDLLKYFGSLYILWIVVLVRLFYILRKTAKHKELLHLKSKMNYIE